MTNIEQNVMRRVRRIALLRMLISGGVFAVVLVILSLYGLGREVWVARVFENGPPGFLGHLEYFVYALEHTRLLVQALVLVLLISMIYFAKETARVIMSSIALRPA